MGANYVSVVVHYGGARIWSSADCVSRSGSRPVVLSPGRPAISWITWNRKTSVPHCLAVGHPVRGATYTATIDNWLVHSKEMVFVLSAPGLAVP